MTNGLKMSAPLERPLVAYHGTDAVIMCRSGRIADAKLFNVVQIWKWSTTR